MAEEYGYSIVIDQIRKAADASSNAAATARGVALSATIDDEIPEAMPGSRSARKAANLAEKWQKQLAGWCDNVDGYAEKVRACADRYATNEEAARACLQQSNFRPEGE